MDLYREAQQFPAALSGAARIVTAPELGRYGLTPGAAQWRARHSGLTRATQGIYLLDGVDLLDRVQVALSVSPPDAAVGFHTAAALQGFGVIEDDVVHLVVPLGCTFPHRKGIRIHQAARPFTPQVSCGVACTPPERTAIDLARGLGRPRALSVMDAALAAGVCTQDDLRDEVARHDKLRGVIRVRPLVDLADGRSACAQETHLRLLVHDAGIAGFVPQQPVVDDSGFERFYLDLGDPVRKVGAEYNGRSHDGRARYDEARANLLDELGWRVRYFNGYDLYRRPRWLIAKLDIALRDR